MENLTYTLRSASAAELSALEAAATRGYAAVEQAGAPADVLQFWR